MGLDFRLLDSKSMALCRGNHRLDKRCLSFRIVFRILGIVGRLRFRDCTFGARIGLPRFDMLLLYEVECIHNMTA